MPLLSSLSRTDYKSKILIHIGLTLTLLSMLLYFGVFIPAQEMSQMKKQIETERVSMEKNYLRVNSLRQLSEKLRIVEPQLSKLENVFIKKEMALDFITSLEKIADGIGINQKINLAGISGTNASPAKGAVKTEAIPVQLSSSGSFFKEMSYLSSLESLNYYINIKNLEISNSSYRGAALSGNDGVESGASDSQVGVQILADTYWQN